MHPCQLPALGLVALAACAAPASGPPPAEAPPDERPVQPSAYRILGDRSFLSGYKAINEDGTVNVVVEIPAGTTAKWEVRSSGMLEWQREDGLPKYVAYLAYPGSYGMVPRTWTSLGEGEPLDALVLGEAIERGRVARTRVVGVLELVEDGRRDDKLIVVRDGTVFGTIGDVHELEQVFPGVQTIVETWFLNHKGAGRVGRVGWGNAEKAQAVLQAAMADYDARGR